MPIELDPHHDHLLFMSPLSEERAARLVGFLRTGEPETVLDLGCGWAELLLRVLAVSPHSLGIGIDTDAASLQHARHLAEQRALSSRVDLRAGDARTLAPTHADAVICIGASQIWGPPVEENRPLDYTSALAALRAIAPAGARVVYGEGIWSSPPTPAATAPLSGRPDELIALPELVELAVGQGFMPVAIEEASLDEWDAFESGYTARYASWLAAHAESEPDAAEVRALAARQRAAYLGGYRGVLGMAYLSLLSV